MSEIAVRVEKLGKKYSLGQRKSGDLRQTFRQAVKSVFNGQASANGDFWALKDVNFEIKRGEVVGIIGRNGAGKSTLLKILSRITEPTTGRFEINGRVSSLLEVGTGFHMELTGRENIFLNGTILGMRRAEIKSKFDEIVAFSGVENFIDTPVKHYSSGMKVRLAFSVAAHLEPEILIIDEVLAVGDAEFQKKCLGKMSEVSKNDGRTILFVSHNLAAIENLCHSGFLLKGGNVVSAGAVGAVISAYLKGPDITRETGPVELANKVFVTTFDISNRPISSLDDVEFKLTLSSLKPNRYNELAILIYNHLQERVGIIDLRDFLLENESLAKKEFTIKGSIKSLPLIEGTYQLGLFISCTWCRGDYLNLKQIEVSQPKKGLIPYPLKYRGYVEFSSEIEVI